MTGCPIFVQAAAPPAHLCPSCQRAAWKDDDTGLGRCGWLPPELVIPEAWKRTRWGAGVTATPPKTAWIDKVTPYPITECPTYIEIGER